MKRFVLFFLLFFTIGASTVKAQEIAEPEFVGEAVLVKDGTAIPLDKEYGRIKIGVSLAHNSWNTKSLAIDGKAATCRTEAGNVTLIVKAVDNNSDPMAVITIYSLKSKSKSRKVDLSSDNSDQLFHSSKTYTKDIMKFTGKKYGKSSYMITTNLKAGEYAIVFKNPNNVDEKNLLLACLGVD